MITKCENASEYLTLSSDSIRFWGIYDLAYHRCIKEPGLFSSMLVFENHYKLVVTAANRRLLMYDLDNLQLLPCEVNASPSPVLIKRMSQKDAKITLQSLQTSKLTLFNSPTTMIHAKFAFTDKSTLLFFIGDDQGFIYAFQIKCPNRRKSTAYQIECIAKTKMHDKSITQISLIESYSSYASSSWDKTVRFWDFDYRNRKFEKQRILKDTSEVMAFKFCEKQKVVITVGISRDIYVWSISPPQRVYKLYGHNSTVIAITDYVTSTNESYLLTMTNRKEFRLWDPASYRFAREWKDLSLYVPENYFSAIFYDEYRHAIISSSSYPIRWSENAEMLENFLEKTTHKHSIIGMHYTKKFEQIITIDSICNFCTWNVLNGKLASIRQTEWDPSAPNLCASAIDVNGRRLLTVDFNNVYQLWNFNSGQSIYKFKLDEHGDINLNNMPFPSSKIETFDPKASIKAQMNPVFGTNSSFNNQNRKRDTLTSCLAYFKLTGRPFLAKGGIDHSVYLYLEVQPESYALFRKFIGHTGEVSAIESHKEGIITGSLNGEIIMWSLETNFSQAQVVLQDHASVESMHCIGNNRLLVGDSEGYIHIFTVPKLNLLDRVKAHGLIVQHSITALDSYNQEILLSGDTFGYVKKWTINTKIEQCSETATPPNNRKPSFHVCKTASHFHYFSLMPIDIHRCHTVDILDIKIVNDGKFFATSGADMKTRLFSMESFEFVGLFHFDSNWNLNDKLTWEMKCPNTEIEQKHFSQQQDKNINDTIAFVFNDEKDDVEDEVIHMTKSNSTLKDNQNLAEQADEDSVEFSAESTRNLIEDFITEEEKITKKFSVEKYKQELSRFDAKMNKKPSHLLQTSMRPNELVSKITNFMNSPWSGNPGRKIDVVKESNKPVLRLPIGVPSSAITKFKFWK